MKTPGITATDEEIICEFMQAKPTVKPEFGSAPLRWWRWIGLCQFHLHCEGHPQPQSPLTLDLLHEVEERLSEEQWELYYHQFGRYEDHPEPVWWSAPDKQYRWALHATAAQKIAALGKVLRHKTPVEN